MGQIKAVYQLSESFSLVTAGEIGGELRFYKKLIIKGLF